MRYGRVLVDGEAVAVVVDADGTARRAGRSTSELLAGAAPAPGEVLTGALLAPLDPGNVIGVGLNYRDTVEQMGWELPSTPYLFPKFASSIVGPGDAVLVDPTTTTRLDWEGELAVVVGRTAKHLTREEALDHVAGYTVANDVSARDVQAADGQWVRGKAMDTFCPLGPVIVTPDEFGDPQSARVRTWVDGELVQDGSTADMVFDVADLLVHVSSYFSLRPGDVLLTGTPAGCGDFMDPPRALHPGSRVEVQVDGIGLLSNPVELDPVQRRPQPPEPPATTTERKEDS